MSSNRSPLGPASLRVERIEGRAVPVRGDAIDTDRIIPARYLRCVTFEGLGDHAFADDRKGLSAQGKVHPFDNPRFRGASILIVNKNFGCGSSREHAPQSLLRWGIKALVGESFAEIFFGNCVALGIPCLTADRAGIEPLMAAVERDPSTAVAIDIAAEEVRFGGTRIAGRLPAGPRDAFLRGIWDATGLLTDRFEEIEAVASRLPYIGGFTC